MFCAERYKTPGTEVELEEYHNVWEMDHELRLVSIICIERQAQPSEEILSFALKSQELPQNLPRRTLPRFRRASMAADLPGRFHVLVSVSLFS